MASLYGVEYTKVTQNVPSEKAAPNKWNNPIRAVYDTYAIAADTAAGDKIYMGKLPKGARVIDVQVSFADLDASGGTMDVGYEYNAAGNALTDDLNAFGDAIDITSAGSYTMAAEGANLPGVGYEIEGDADIVISSNADWDATSGTIKCCVLYIMP